MMLLDIDYKAPDWVRHLAVAQREHPWLAAVPDVMSEAQLPEALGQAEEMAPHCERVLMIPKAPVVDGIPERVGGVPVVLGYSVPTSYGGCDLMLWEFGRRPVHLLGGSPRAQRELTRYLYVVSADGNMVWNEARKGRVYDRRGVSSGNTLRALDGERWSGDGPYEALRRSLINLREFWGLDA